MIFAVVLGHFIEPFIQSHPFFKTIYVSLYSFHMPVFILISGMLSRATLSFQSIKRLTRTLILPFITFTLIYEIGHVILFAETSKYLTRGVPHWLLWYLPSLFFWRATLPFVSKIPFNIAMSFICAILIGFVTDIHEMLGFSRTIYFWPFFLLGFKLTPQFLDHPVWQNIPKFVWLIILSAILLHWGSQDINYKTFFGDLSYVKLDQHPIPAAFMRMIIIATSMLSCLAIMALMPRKLAIPAHWKSNTLPVYLWHGLIVKVLLVLNLKDVLETWPELWLMITIIMASLALTFILSSKLVASATRLITFAPKPSATKP